MKRFIDFLVYSNLFIAICAIALTTEAFVLFEIPLGYYWMLPVIGGSTLLVYNLHYIVKSRKDKQDGRLFWVRNHSLLIYIMSAMAAILLCLLISQHHAIFFLQNHRINVYKLIVFTSIPLLALAYSHKIIPGTRKTIREWAWFKPIYLALIWAVTTAIIPIALVLPTLFKINMAAIFAYTLSQFVGMVWLCILFNIKDYNEDKKDGLKTLAVQFGQENVLQYGKWIMIAISAVSTTIFLLTYPSSNGLMICVTLMILCLHWYSFNRFIPNLTVAQFVIRYDGLMIVKAALLIFAKLI